MNTNHLQGTDSEILDFPFAFADVCQMPSDVLSLWGTPSDVPTKLALLVDDFVVVCGR